MHLRSVVVAACLWCAATPTFAQGRGNALGKGRHTPAATTSAATGESSSTVIGGGSISAREFGAWLDDATPVDQGSGWLSVALGSYHTPGGHQTDLPSLDAAFGWRPNVQFGVTMPYTRFSTSDGLHASGRGDMYLSAKIAAREPRKRDHGPAVAVTPLIEILSDPDPVHGGRLFWGLPVSAEIDRGTTRLYGSGGYFSRGVFFGSGAVEMPATSRLITTAALTWTHSLVENPAADAEAMAATRVDLTGAATYRLTSSIAAFGSLGRTISKTDINSATLMMNVGLSFNFTTGRRPTPSPTPPSRRE